MKRRSQSKERKTQKTLIPDLASADSSLFGENSADSGNKKRRRKAAQRRSLSLRELVERIPGEEDLFPEVFDKEEILRAVDRILETNVAGVFRFWFLKECADRTARHYPDISARIMERVAEAAASASAAGNTRFYWQNGHLLAADFWLKAGDREQQLDVLLQASTLTLRCANQLSLFPGIPTIDIEPLWRFAKELSESGKREAAVGIYRKIAEYVEREDLALETLRAKMIMAREFAHLDRWDEVGSLADSIIEQSSRIREDSIYEFDGHIMRALYLIKKDRKRFFREALGELDEAKRILQEGEECTQEDEQRLYVLLARVHGLASELLLDEFMLDNADSALKSAENAAVLCLAYLERLSDAELADLGHAYAMLSTIYSLQGEVELANSYRDKAMVIGFDLSGD